MRRSIGDRPGVMFHKRLGSVSVRDEELSLRIVSDDHPLCELAARLWLDVYGDEFGYLRSCDDDSSPVTRGRRSMVILALLGERCVGSLRMAYKKHTPSEFEFEHCPAGLEGELGALSRLVVAREFRKTTLSLHMLSLCHKFHRECSEASRYDHVLVTCAPEMLHFYRTFGFELARPDFVKSSTFTDELFLVRCSRATNDRMVALIDRVLAGDSLAKAQMAVRYQYFKLASSLDPRVRAARLRTRAEREGAEGRARVARASESVRGAAG